MIRVCLKLLITIMFKGSTHRILFFEGPLNQISANNNIQRDNNNPTKTISSNYDTHHTMWE